MKKSILPELSLLLVAIFWGGGFVAVKDALNAFTPFYLVGIRFLVPAVLLALLFYKKMKATQKSELISGAIIGLFLSLGFVMQTVGLQYTLPGKQAFLTAIYVIMVPLLYWVIKRIMPDRYTVTAVFLTLLGIGLITLQEGFHLNTGDWWSLLADLFFALQIIAVGHFINKCDTMRLVIIQMFTAGFLSLLLAFIFEPVPGMPTTSAWLSLGYLIIFSTTLAYIIQNAAQKYVSPTNTAIIMSLESVFGAIFSILLAGEVFTASKIIGCIVIFCAIIISETKLSFITSHLTEAISEEQV